jgi:hypothetical protein
MRFLESAHQVPLRHIVLADFDGDGMTDFACSPAPKEYAVWLFTEKGFSAAPAFRRVFPTGIAGIALRDDLDGQRRTSIVLRGEGRLYVLKAIAPPPASPLPPAETVSSRAAEVAIDLPRP